MNTLKFYFTKLIGYAQSLGISTKIIDCNRLPIQSTFSRININRMILVLTFSALTSSGQAAAISGIWAVNDGEKVEKFDLKNPNKASNSVWDGTKIKIFGGRNEMIAFQVIVQGEINGSTVGASLPGLTRRGGGGSIVYTAPASDPTDYRNRPISIFTENYMNLTKATNCSWIYNQYTPSAPADPLGWKPVQLVPENATAGKGGLPILVAANSNQGLWFDIYTAKGLQAGIYEGTVTITRNGTPTAIPIELELFNFTLPDENTIATMIYNAPWAYPTYHTIAASAANDAYDRMAHRFRVELVDGWNESYINSNMKKFNGSLYTSANKYDGPGVGVGQKIIPRTFYPDINAKPTVKGFDTESEAWASSDAWMTYMNNTFPQQGWKTFFYMPDEPWWNQAAEKMAYIKRVGAYLRSNPGIGNTMPVLVTSHWDAGLDPLIDIWASNMDTYNTPQGVIERSHGDDFWVYNGFRPFGGAAVYDCPATDERVNYWGCFKKGVPVYFYYYANLWDINPWTNPETFPNGMGDGCVMYPGECKFDQSQNRNINGPISGIALANMRRGAQDHAYLTMARERGLTSTITTVLNNIVPKIFDDVKNAMSEKCYFPQNGNAYESARYTLAQALAKFTPDSTTYLSDLMWSSATNSWGPVEKDKSNGEINIGDGNTITLNGITYSKGLGSHAPMEATYFIGGLYKTLISDIGVDDEMESTGSVIFQVWADSVKIYDSGIMTYKDTTKTIHVDISGVNELKLIVTNGGDGIVGDHADWANTHLIPLTTGVDVPVSSGSINSFALSQNVPNPVRNETTIGFNIPASVVNAEINIYNLQGIKVKAYNIAERGFGSLNILSSGLNPAIYFYVLVCDNTIVATKKMIIIKE